MRRSITLLLPLAVLAALAVAPVAADGDRITRGDVQAYFGAALNGGTAIASNAGTARVVAPPANDPRISWFVGGTYCSLDWHLVSVIAFGDDKAVLAGTEVAFEITGVGSDDLKVGPIKPAVPRTDPWTWWRAYGLFYAPGVLPLGTHTLTTTVTFPGEAPFTFPAVQIEIVGSSAAACQ
jgi:hypothetical protein